MIIINIWNSFRGNVLACRWVCVLTRVVRRCCCCCSCVFVCFRVFSSVDCFPRRVTRMKGCREPHKNDEMLCSQYKHDLTANDRFITVDSTPASHNCRRIDKRLDNCTNNDSTNGLCCAKLNTDETTSSLFSPLQATLRIYQPTLACFRTDCRCLRAAR